MKYSTKVAVRKSLSTPIHMDNVACRGTEENLTDCSYNTDTSEGTHSQDIWIDCSSVSSDSDTNREGSMRAGTVTTELAVALVALTVSLLMSVALVGYILCTKQKICRIRFAIEQLIIPSLFV